MYPRESTKYDWYLCHTKEDCPAWCVNCKKKCKVFSGLLWCPRFVLKETTPQNNPQNS